MQKWEKKAYGYDIRVDSDYKITIKEEVLQLEWICGVRTQKVRA